MSTVLPERLIYRALTLGVAAITDADLDDILGGSSGLPDADLVKLKAFWAGHKPGVTAGYPRRDQVFPLYAVTLLSEAEDSKYLGSGDMSLLDDMDARLGDALTERRSETLAVWVVSDNYEITAAYYRIARRILHVATRWLIERGLDLPTLTGADLAPEQELAKESMFVRRLTISVQYNEEWPTNGTLWATFNSEEAFVTTSDKVAAHVDDVFFVDDDGDEFRGAISAMEDE